VSNGRNFAQNIDPGPNAYQNLRTVGGLERPNRVVFSNDGKTMYVVDYGEVYTTSRCRRLSIPWRSLRDLDHHLYGRQLAIGLASSRERQFAASCAGCCFRSATETVCPHIGWQSGGVGLGAGVAGCVFRFGFNGYTARSR